MKKIINAFILIFILILFSGIASAYTIDGNISDWGVDLASGLSGSESAWVPNIGTTDWIVEDNIDPDCPSQGVMPDWKGHNCLDWTGFKATGMHIKGTGSSYSVYDEPVSLEYSGNYEFPAGGEKMDIEAIYFDDDTQYGYFAIVLSMGPSGADIGGRHIDPGDLAIDLDNNPATGEFGYEYGIKLTGENEGQVCYLPDWSVPSDFPLNKPSTLDCDAIGSVIMGNATVVYANAGVSDNDINNWIIEIRVGKSLIGNPPVNQLSDLHTSISCGNDEIEINGYEWNNLPEFTTIGAALVLIGSGLYARYKRRKR